MKKTLIAIAALAATGAFAQSTVTIDGYFDRGYVTTNNSNNTKDTKAVGSNAGTTTIGIKVSEDLGAGLKMGLSVNTDWADLGGLAQGTVVAQSGAFANSQSFAELSDAKMGTLRLGTINNEILTAAVGVAAPAFSTGVGSAYSSSWSTFNGYGTGSTGLGGIVNAPTVGATNAGVRGIRQANTIKYVSPNFSGLTFAYGFAPKNDVSGTGYTVGATDMSIGYANGPLNVTYASIKYEVGSVTPTSATATATAAAGANNTHSLLAASYQVMPALKLHAGFGASKASDTAIANSTSSQFGVTYVVGQFNILAQVAKVSDKNTVNYDRSMTGLGVDYNLSKTARVYARYDNLNLYSNGTDTATGGSLIKRMAVGVSKSF